MREPITVGPEASGAPPSAQNPDVDVALQGYLPAVLPAASLGYRVAKRALDLVGSGLVLLLLSPLFLVAALLIRATSRGPVFYRQERVGEDGHVFTMYKFRSMYRDADAALHQLAYMRFIQDKAGDGKVNVGTLAPADMGQIVDRFPAAPDAPDAPDAPTWPRRGLRRVRPRPRSEDPRITPIGGLLRKTSIDELPQLLNVLRGQMSLVGPRPPIPYELQWYQMKHLLRLTVRPGMTGMWQVYGRGRVPFECMVDMDIAYIKRRSLLLDLKLLVLTLPSMLLARGA